MKQFDQTPLFTQSGIVEHGIDSAKTIGFPTANVHFEEPDISGTYAGKVVVEGVEYRAAVYANQKRHVLEAHILDFSGDLYGKRITVILLERLIDTEKFRDRKDEQTFVDWAVTEVRKYFNREE